MKLDGPRRNGAAERRAHPRRRVFLRFGAVLDDRGERLLPCVIKDISEGGVRIKVQADEVSGDELVLIDKRGGTERRAKIVWRSRNELGLAFVGEPRLGRPRESGR